MLFKNLFLDVEINYIFSNIAEICMYHWELWVPADEAAYLAHSRINQEIPQVLKKRSLALKQNLV